MLKQTPRLAYRAKQFRVPRATFQANKAYAEKLRVQARHQFQQPRIDYASVMPVILKVNFFYTSPFSGSVIPLTLALSLTMGAMYLAGPEFIEESVLDFYQDASDASIRFVGHAKEAGAAALESAGNGVEKAVDIMVGEKQFRKRMQEQDVGAPFGYSDHVEAKPEFSVKVFSSALAVRWLISGPAGAAINRAIFAAPIAVTKAGLNDKVAPGELKLGFKANLERQMKVPFSAPPKGASYVKHFTPTVQKLVAGSVPAWLGSAVVNKFVIKVTIEDVLMTYSGAENLPKPLVSAMAGSLTALPVGLATPGDVWESRMQKAVTPAEVEAAKLRKKNILPRLTLRQPSQCFFSAARGDVAHNFSGMSARVGRDFIGYPIFFGAATFFNDVVFRNEDGHSETASLVSKLAAGQFAFASTGWANYIQNEKATSSKSYREIWKNMKLWEDGFVRGWKGRQFCALSPAVSFFVIEQVIKKCEEIFLKELEDLAPLSEPARTASATIEEAQDAPRIVFAR